MAKAIMMQYSFLSWPKPLNGKSVSLGLLGLAIALTFPRRLILLILNCTSSRDCWISAPIFSASSQFTCNSSLTVTPFPMENSSVKLLKGHWFLNQSWNVSRSVKSRLIRAFLCSTCYSLVSWIWLVKGDIAQWMPARRLIEWIHMVIAFSSMPLPLFYPTQLLTKLIKICSIRRSDQRPAQYLSLLLTAW